MASTDLGAFGTKILAEYCGSDIANQFYDESHPMLLTERKMAFITTQLMIEFMISTFITILFQITFRIYIRSMSSCCFKCKRRSKKTDDHEHNKISLEITTVKMKKKALKEWNNDDIISWINTTDIEDDIKTAFIEEIKKYEITGTDIASLQNVNDFIETFASISDNTELCDKLYFHLKDHEPAAETTDNTSVSKQDEDIDETSTSPNCCFIKVLMVICVIWSYLLAFMVMIHFFHQLHLYFKFVRNTVEFDSTDAQTLEECEAQGIGRIACPDLFEQFEKYQKDDPYGIINEAYTLQNAENICFWIYNMLVISNPTLYQYAWFASFVIIDFDLYQIIMFLLGCVCITSCDCWMMFACWCGCCCVKCDSFCCPIPRCCCHLAWGNVCCKEGCCCYTLYGCCGFVGWLLQWVLAFVVMAFAVNVLAIPLAVIAGVFSVVTFVIIVLLTLPLCVCNPKCFCCLVFETYMGNGEAVDLKVNTINRNDRRWNESGQYLWLQFLCRGLIPIPMPLDERNKDCGDRFVLDPIELRAWSHATMLTGLTNAMLIAGVQTLISTFIIYFVVDGTIFMPWHYFEPFYHGVKDAFVLLVHIIQDEEKLKDILMESISLDSFIDFSTKQPDGFKYALLLHRTVLHTLIGIIYVLLNPY